MISEALKAMIYIRKHHSLKFLPLFVCVYMLITESRLAHLPFGKKYCPTALCEISSVIMLFTMLDFNSIFKSFGLVRGSSLINQVYEGKILLLGPSSAVKRGHGFYYES